MSFPESENKKSHETASSASSLETLRLLYPIFKEEVYRRRAAMAHIARIGTLFYLTLIFAFLFFPEKVITGAEPRYAVVAGIICSAILLIYQIAQEKSRHEKAKLQLITLEKAFGFFEVGKHIANKTLYPSNWRDRPKVDQALVLMCLSIAGTATILIFTILSGSQEAHP